LQKLQDEALMMIAKAAGGSFRDAHKLLEQLYTGKKLTKGKVSKKLETTDAAELKEFIRLLEERNTKKLIKFIEELSSKGVNIKAFVLEIIETLKKKLLAFYGLGEDEFEINFGKRKLIGLIELFDEVYGATGMSAIQQLPLELAVIRWCGDFDGEKSGGVKLGDDQKEEKGEKKGSKKHSTKKSEVYKNGKNEESVKVVVDEKSISEDGVLGTNGDLWKQVLLVIRTKNTSTEALLRAAKPLDLKNGVLTVGVFYNFHKERLESHSHRMLLEDTLCEVLGKRVKIVCKLTKPPVKPELIEVEEKSTNGKESNGEVKGEEKEETVLTPKEDDDIVKIAEKIFG
jgi:hypothetical protein